MLILNKVYNKTIDWTVHLLESDKYSEQRETFKRVNNVKCGGTDLSEPITFHRAAIMSINKKSKASNHEEIEH